ncbi:hypothetical protein EW146_g9765, partial [Bondarzewia mesenterica]
AGATERSALRTTLEKDNKASNRDVSGISLPHVTRHDEDANEPARDGSAYVPILYYTVMTALGNRTPALPFPNAKYQTHTVTDTRRESAVSTSVHQYEGRRWDEALRCRSAPAMAECAYIIQRRSGSVDRNGKGDMPLGLQLLAPSPVRVESEIVVHRVETRAPSCMALASNAHATTDYGISIQAIPRSLSEARVSCRSKASHYLLHTILIPSGLLLVTEHSISEPGRTLARARDDVSTHTLSRLRQCTMSEFSARPRAHDSNVDVRASLSTHRPLQLSPTLPPSRVSTSHASSPSRCQWPQTSNSKKTAIYIVPRASHEVRRSTPHTHPHPNRQTHKSNSFLPGPDRCSIPSTAALSVYARYTPHQISRKSQHRPTRACVLPNREDRRPDLIPPRSPFTDARAPDTRAPCECTESGRPGTVVIRTRKEKVDSPFLAREARRFTSTGPDADTDADGVIRELARRSRARATRARASTSYVRRYANAQYSIYINARIWPGRYVSADRYRAAPRISLALAEAPALAVSYGDKFDPARASIVLLHLHLPVLNSLSSAFLVTPSPLVRPFAVSVSFRNASGSKLEARTRTANFFLYADHRSGHHAIKLKLKLKLKLQSSPVRPSKQPKIEFAWGKLELTG